MTENTQIKNSFDPETIAKIMKGAAISGIGATALFILNAVGTIEAGDWTPVIAFLVPFLTNLIREYVKGEVDR